MVLAAEMGSQQNSPVRGGRFGRIGAPPDQAEWIEKTGKTRRFGSRRPCRAETFRLPEIDRSPRERALHFRSAIRML